MKLTSLQKHQLKTALENASAVLREVKNKPLKGEALKEMKMLEAAVQSLEVLSLT